MQSTLKRITISLIIIIFPVISAADGDWQLIADQEGITLYTREVSGYTEAQFKGVCMVNRPLETVGSILADIDSYPKWFFKCIEARKIPAENSSELQFFLYVAIDTPWPFSDRDAVYKTEIAIDYALGKVVIRSAALKQPLVPLRRQYVRITDSENQWILEKISADFTRITFINRTNAGGPFANYLSNPGTRDTTVHSLENLKHQKLNPSNER
jgi:hypothetical protein